MPNGGGFDQFGSNMNQMNAMANMAGPEGLPNMARQMNQGGFGHFNNNYNNKGNMFVRKAKGDGESGKRRGYNGGKDRNNNVAKSGTTYSFPGPNNNNQAESPKRPRLDSDNFPALPNKCITVDVPTGPLEDDDDEDRLTRRVIINKFKELKEQNAITIAKSLVDMDDKKVPIIERDAVPTLEEIEPTIRKESWTSPVPSGNNSRKVSHNNIGDSPSRLSPHKFSTGSNYTGTLNRKGSGRKASDK